MDEYKFMGKLFSDLPMQPDDLDERVNDTCLRYSRYLFTWREKNIRYGYCTHCGHTSQLYPYGKIYDYQDAVNAKCKHNDVGFCPCCKSTVTFKDSGRGRGKMTDYGYFLIAQPLKDGGILVSSFYVMRDYRRDYHNVQTQYSEHYRVYFNTGVCKAYRRTRNNEQYYGILDREDYFDGECDRLKIIGWEPMKTVPRPQYNASNIFAKYIPPNYYFDFTDENFKNTNLRYSCIDRFMKYYHGSDREPDVCRYLNFYVKNPILTERLMKQGYEQVVCERVEKKYNTQGHINWRAKTAEKAFKLTKGELRTVGKDTLSIVHKHFTDKLNIKNPKYAAFIAGVVKGVYFDFAEKTLNELSKYAPQNKVLKYLCGLKGQPYSVLSDYRDYIHQCEKLNLDLTKSFILFPQDFEKAHSENSMLLTEIQHKKDLERAKKQDEEFKDRYRELCKKYAWKNENLIIRPAKGKGDLMIEGKTLNHCVYTNYADKYINGKTIILLIRKAEAPDVPFFTLELSNSGAVIQCRGMRNCGKTPEVEKFVSDWLNEIAHRKKKSKKQKVGSAA